MEKPDRVGRQASQALMGHPQVKGWPEALPSWSHGIRLPQDIWKPSRVPLFTQGRRAPDWSKIRKDFARHGEAWWPIPWRPHDRRPGRVVVLWDVSGSMASYVPLYLPWLYRWAEAAEVSIFAFGTRVVEVTGYLQQRSVADAARQLAAVDVFGAGTAIGQALDLWQRQWGGACLSPSTSVLIVSDGWDVGAPELLASALTTLRPRIRRLIWVHPLMASPGFEPKTRALKVATRFIDRMVPGGSGKALLELVQRLR